MINTFVRRLYDYQQDQWHEDGMQLGYKNPDNDRLLELLGDKVTVKIDKYRSSTIKAVVKPSVNECLSEFHWDRASNELALYIMLTGEYHNYYGRYDGATMSGFVKLLLDEPINWEKSSEPESQRWSEFAGTFAEQDDYQDMLSVEFTCGDSYYPEHRFGIEIPSIADIIKSSSGFFLNKLED